MLAVSSSLSDLPDFERCPVTLVIEHKPLLDRIFNEYRAVKRLGLRGDPSIPTPYLVALDQEIAAIEQRQYERMQRDRKAKQMKSRRA